MRNGYAAAGKEIKERFSENRFSENRFSFLVSGCVSRYTGTTRNQKRETGTTRNQKRETN